MLPTFKEEFVKITASPSAAFPERKSIFKPYISIRLFNKADEENYIDLKALIDSGAGVSIFPGLFGQAIGLTVENDRIEKIQGIGGQSFDTYLHDIVLGVGGWKFDSYICFTFANIVCPVLGREGFFDLFEIKIDYLKKEMKFKANVV